MRILLIKRGALGDILMTTPLVRQLKRHFPNAIIDYCVGRSFHAALKNNPYLNKCLLVDDHIFTLKGIVQYLKLSCAYRKNYDYVFILDKHWYFAIAACVIGGKKIGFMRDQISRFLLDRTVIYSDSSRYQSLYYLDLLSCTGLAEPEYQDLMLDLVISAEDQIRAEELSGALQLKEYVVVVNSGGNNQYEHTGIRMLPENKILNLLQELLDQEKKVILLGGSVDTVNYQKYIAKLKSPTNLIDLSGKCNLAVSAWLIKNSSHFYTTDCGAMHLGVAMNVFAKMTAYFGPTSPTHFLPHQHLDCAVWRDQDIFEPEYQLNGRLPKSSKKFFTR